MTALGTHCILELYGCRVDRLDDADYVLAKLREAAERAGAAWLGEIRHRFHPQGVTALGLLAESHIAVHTWPEAAYAGADVFTCGDTAMPEKACAFLVEAFQAQRHVLRRLERGAEASLPAVLPPAPPAAAPSAPAPLLAEPR